MTLEDDSNKLTSGLTKLGWVCLQMLRRPLLAVINLEVRLTRRLLGTNDTPLKKIEEKLEDLKVTILGDKFKSKRQRDQEEKNKRQGPFKYYFDQDERDKGKIMKNEQFFDEHCKFKDRANFMVSLPGPLATHRPAFSVPSVIVYVCP